jgi:DNA-binding transcriptional LysR family regulator
MPRADLDDLLAFIAVARERSFTRAAAKLGVSQSALSQPSAASKHGLASGC